MSIETALAYAQMARRDIDNPKVPVETVKDCIGVAIDQLEDVSKRMREQRTVH